MINEERIHNSMLQRTADPVGYLPVHIMPTFLPWTVQYIGVSPFHLRNMFFMNIQTKETFPLG